MDDVTFPEIRDAVARLCAGFPGEYWRRLDEKREYPTAFVQALTREGWLGGLIPEEYGGSGLGLEAAGAVLEEIHRSGGNGGAAHAQMYTMGAILKHGSPEQKQRYLPAIARGELRLQAFGVTEPDAGTDTTRITTFARLEGDKYIVNGQMGRGLTIRPIRTMINHATTELFFDDMEVPVENLVGIEGQGFRYILDGMNAERVLIAFECIGDGKFFIDKASAYAKARNVFGRPIGQNQGVQFPIARSYVQLKAAELMAQDAARKFDAGEAMGTEANMAKMLASEASWGAADTCIQTHGGFGFAEDYDVERKFRETRLYQVAPISTNLILSHVATHVLGLPKSF
jgi:acyl-CoA dehydrogenase